MPNFLLSNLLFMTPALLLVVWCVRWADHKNKAYEVWMRLELEE
ncbi:MAG: hypothetical protein ACR2FY_27105 [Pirellulaceae bacterium]